MNIDYSYESILNFVHPHYDALSKTMNYLLDGLRETISSSDSKHTDFKSILYTMINYNSYYSKAQSK